MLWLRIYMHAHITYGRRNPGVILSSLIDSGLYLALNAIGIGMTKA